MQTKVFISFVKEDIIKAKIIKDRLVREGIMPWTYDEDNHTGDFRNGIVEAISESKIMILVFSKETERSEHISRELREASIQHTEVIPFFVEDIDISDIGNGAIRYEIGALNWVKGWEEPFEAQLDLLMTNVKKSLDRAVTQPGESSSINEEVTLPKHAAPPSTLNLWKGISIGALVLISGYIGYQYYDHAASNLFVCYDVRTETAEGGYFYKGCVKSAEPCKKGRFGGNYPTRKEYQAAFDRCIKGTPRPSAMKEIIAQSKKNKESNSSTK